MKNGTGWAIQWLVDHRPDHAALQTRLALAAAALDIALPPASLDLVIEKVPDINWLEESYRGFAPFAVGPFYICGTHTAPQPQGGQITLMIDAATAFGSGEHGTTAACLLLLDRMKRSGWTPRGVLDMGCGSGILGIAACKLWSTPVLAADIDPECVRVTNYHNNINNTAAQMETLVCDGFSSLAASYDLIIANILAGPLVEMADDLLACLNPGGYAVLSGMLQTQAEKLTRCYGTRGARLQHRVDRDEWSALLLRKDP